MIKSLLYNKPMPENSEQLVQVIMESGSGTSVPDEWWLDSGFVLNSCRELSVAMRKRGGPLLDGAPVTVTVEAGNKVTVETDLLVVGCATGVRIFGSVVDTSRMPAISLEANDCEFFEPSEEFGITKALTKCEAELRPQLPNADAPLRMTLEPRYFDEELLIIRATIDNVEGSEPMTLVLSKDEAAVEVAKRRRG